MSWISIERNYTHSLTHSLCCTCYTPAIYIFISYYRIHYVSIEQCGRYNQLLVSHSNLIAKAINVRLVQRSLIVPLSLISSGITQRTSLELTTWYYEAHGHGHGHTNTHIWRWNNKYGSQPAQIIISLLPNYGGRRIAVIDGNVAVMFADLKATHSIAIAFLFLFLDK